MTVGYQKPFEAPVSAGILPGTVKETVVLPMNGEQALEDALKKETWPC